MKMEMKEYVYALYAGARWVLSLIEMSMQGHANFDSILFAWKSIDYDIWSEENEDEEEDACLLCPAFTRWIWGMWKMNLETVLVWKMIKRSLWRTYNFKGSTQTVGFQSISQSLISSPCHKWIWISLAVAYYLLSNCRPIPKWSALIYAGIYSQRQKLHQMLLC